MVELAESRIETELWSSSGCWRKCEAEVHQFYSPYEISQGRSIRGRRVKCRTFDPRTTLEVLLIVVGVFRALARL